MSDSTSFSVHHPFPDFQLFGRLNGGSFQQLPLESTGAPIWDGKYSTVVTGATVTLTFSGVTTADAGEFYFRALSPDPGRSLDSDVKQLTVGDLEFEYQPQNHIISLYTGGSSWYVSNSGHDDDNDGATEGTPVATLSRVNELAQYGDTVYVDSGSTFTSYDECMALECSEGVTYDGKTWGTGTRAKLVATQNSTYYRTSACVRMAKSAASLIGFDVDGGGQPFSGMFCYGIFVGEAIDWDLNDILIEDCVVHHVGDPEFYNESGGQVPPPGGAGNVWIYGVLVSNKSSYRISNVSVIDSVFHTCRNEAIALYQAWNYPTPYDNGTNGALVRGCEVYNNGNGTYGGGQGILVANNTNDAIIEFNHVYNNGLNGIWVRTSPTPSEPSSGAPTNCHVRNNIVYSNGASGISLTSGSNGYQSTVNVYNNLFYDNATSELNIGNTETTGSIYKIYNNTFASINAGGTQTVGLLPSSGYVYSVPAVEFVNNAIFAGDNFAITMRQDILTTASNNVIYSPQAGTPILVIDGINRDADPDKDIPADVQVNYTSANISDWAYFIDSSTDAPGFTGGSLPTGFTGTFGTDLVPNSDYFLCSAAPVVDLGTDLPSPFDSAINLAGIEDAPVRESGVFDIGAHEDVSAGLPPLTSLLLNPHLAGGGYSDSTGLNPPDNWFLLSHPVGTSSSYSPSAIYADSFDITWTYGGGRPYLYQDVSELAGPAEAGDYIVKAQMQVTGLAGASNFDIAMQIVNSQAFTNINLEERKVDLTGNVKEVFITFTAPTAEAFESVIFRFGPGCYGDVTGGTCRLWAPQLIKLA